MFFYNNEALIPEILKVVIINQKPARVWEQVIYQEESLHKKMKFSIEDFISKCGKFRSFWSHLLKKSLMKNFILCAMSLEFFG